MASDSQSLEQFPHFKSQWTPLGNIYRHLHSPDQCQLKVLTAVPMRELDLYSSREAYSYPFCPRVYKYNIDRTEISDSQVTFDIKLIFEQIPNRFNSSPKEKFREEMGSRIREVLKAVVYLFARFGAFRVRREMIGWSELGIAKVWINQDFSSNQVQEVVGSEGEMVADVVGIFQDHPALENCEAAQFETLKDLLVYVQKFEREEKIVYTKKGALKSLENYAPSHSFFGRSSKHCRDSVGDLQAGNTRKNITFSYSNKSFNQPEFVQRSSKKKSSIAVMVENEAEYQGLSKVLSMKKEFTFGENAQESSSLKMLQPIHKHQRKLSCFRPSVHPETASVQTSGQFKIKKLSDHFSQIANPNHSHINTPTINAVRQRFNTRPELLHYSTSSNPYSKFVNKKASKEKSVNVFNQRDGSLQKQKENKRKTVGFDTNLYEQKEGMKNSQQLRNDLDALFTQDNQFDYKQLQNDLQNVLL